MTPGITLVVVGAILAFAVKAEPSGVDVQRVGWILLLTGVGLIVYEVYSSRNGGDDTRRQGQTGRYTPGSRARTGRDPDPDKDRT